MSSYQAFTTTRTTEADPAALFTTLRGLDATAGVQHAPGSKDYVLKKATAWTTPQINAAQNAIDTAPALTDQSAAQAFIDSIPLYQKAIVLALIDQLNVIRAALPTPLGAITPAQAIAAIRAKAGTL